MDFLLHSEGVEDWRERRRNAATWAMQKVPVKCAVEAKEGQNGFGLFASKDCDEGEILLAVPLSACITAGDIPTSAPIVSRIGSDDSDLYGRGVIALLLALEAAESKPQYGIMDEEKIRVECVEAAAYLRAVAPELMLRWLVMVGWDESSASADIVRGTVAWARATAHQSSMIKESTSLGMAGVSSCQGKCALSMYRYAQLLLQTRSFMMSSGPILCPVMDLTNHLSFGSNAKTSVEDCPLQCGQAPCIVLRATSSLCRGAEVFKNYDADADYSDIFERYGFLDVSSTLHTAEVYVPHGTFDSGTSESREVKLCRAQLIAKAEKIGCDSAFQAWWVSDFHLLRCPLIAAARITSVSSAGITALSGNENFENCWTSFQLPLQNSIEEMTALSKVIDLINAQVYRIENRDSGWEKGIRSNQLSVLQEEEESDDGDTEKESKHNTNKNVNYCYSYDRDVDGMRDVWSSEAVERAICFASYELNLLRGAATQLSEIRSTLRQHI